MSEEGMTTAQIADYRIKKLEAQIKAMRSCNSCMYYGAIGEQTICDDCDKDYSKWKWEGEEE